MFSLYWLFLFLFAAFFYKGIKLEGRRSEAGSAAGLSLAVWLGLYFLLGAGLSSRWWASFCSWWVWESIG